MTDLSAWSWIVFGSVFGTLFIVDLLTHRNTKKDSRKRAVVWTTVWIAAGVGFAGFVWAAGDGSMAGEYLAAYAIEKSLSLDNLFVFLLVFKSLNISEAQQRKALLWGIFGALVFRAIFIFAGTSAIERWTWLEYVFGGILFVAAWHAFREDPSEKKKSAVVEWLSRHLPVSKQAEASTFVVEEKGSRKATRLLVAVLAIEMIDIVFAVDSVPAALSVTRDKFLIYSSNAFAILGLRSLYIVMAATIAHMRYLHYGLAAVLAFAGLKMVLGETLEIPPLLSVAIIAGCVGVAAWMSRADEERDRKRAA